MVNKDEVPPDQQQWSPLVDQEDPEPPNIKKEQEEPLTTQDGQQLQGLEEADVKFTLDPVAVKSEEDEEKLKSSKLHPSERKENRADCGGPEPARNSGPDVLLQPGPEDKAEDSSETESKRGHCWLGARSLCFLSKALFVHSKRRNLSTVQLLRVLVEKGGGKDQVPELRAMLTERLAGLEETLLESEERVERTERSQREVCRQRRLLDAAMQPVVRLHRAAGSPGRWVTIRRGHSATLKEPTIKEPPAHGSNRLSRDHRQLHPRDQSRGIESKLKLLAETKRKYSKIIIQVGSNDSRLRIWESFSHSIQTPALLTGTHSQVGLGTRAIVPSGRFQYNNRHSFLHNLNTGKWHPVAWERLRVGRNEPRWRKVSQERCIFGGGERRRPGAIACASPARRINGSH
ncbi:unnamed protein product, partial [Pleuronectes platessa]